MRSKKKNESELNRRDVFRAGALAGAATWLAPESAQAANAAHSYLLQIGAQDEYDD